MSDINIDVINYFEEDLTKGLAAWFRCQELVEMIGMPEALDPSNDNIRTYMLAAEEEIHELGRELNWRPWHAKRPQNIDNILKEYSDVLAFVGLLGNYVMSVTGCSHEELAKTFIAVCHENARVLIEKRKPK